MITIFVFIIGIIQGALAGITGSQNIIQNDHQIDSRMRPKISSYENQLVLRNLNDPIALKADPVQYFRVYQPENGIVKYPTEASAHLEVSNGFHQGKFPDQINAIGVQPYYKNIIFPSHRQVKPQEQSKSFLLAKSYGMQKSVNPAAISGPNSQKNFRDRPLGFVLNSELAPDINLPLIKKGKDASEQILPPASNQNTQNNFGYKIPESVPESGNVQGYHNPQEFQSKPEEIPENNLNQQFDAKNQYSNPLDSFPGNGYLSNSSYGDNHKEKVMKCDLVVSEVKALSNNNSGNVEAPLMPSNIVGQESYKFENLFDRRNVLDLLQYMKNPRTFEQVVTVLFIGLNLLVGFVIIIIAGSFVYRRKQNSKTDMHKRKKRDDSEKQQLNANKQNPRDDGDGKGKHLHKSKDNRDFKQHKSTDTYDVNSRSKSNHTVPRSERRSEPPKKDEIVGTVKSSENENKIAQNVWSPLSLLKGAKPEMVEATPKLEEQVMVPIYEPTEEEVIAECLDNYEEGSQILLTNFLKNQKENINTYEDVRANPHNYVSEHKKNLELHYQEVEKPAKNRSVKSENAGNQALIAGGDTQRIPAKNALPFSNPTVGKIPGKAFAINTLGKNIQTQGPQYFIRYKNSDQYSKDDKRTQGITIFRSTKASSPTDAKISKMGDGNILKEEIEMDEKPNVSQAKQTEIALQKCKSSPLTNEAYFQCSQDKKSKYKSIGAINTDLNSTCSRSSDDSAHRESHLPVSTKSYEKLMGSLIDFTESDLTKEMSSEWGFFDQESISEENLAKKCFDDNCNMYSKNSTSKTPFAKSIFKSPAKSPTKGKRDYLATLSFLKKSPKKDVSFLSSSNNILHSRTDSEEKLLEEIDIELKRGESEGEMAQNGDNIPAFKILPNTLSYDHQQLQASKKFIQVNGVWKNNENGPGNFQ